MPEEMLKRAGGIFDSSWKIVSVIGAFVYAIYLGSVEHFTNKEHRVSFENYKMKQEQEDKIRDERADKRYSRASEMYNELLEKGEKLEAELEKHLIEDAYFRGKTDALLQKK